MTHLLQHYKLLLARPSFLKPTGTFHLADFSYLRVKEKKQQGPSQLANFAWTNNTVLALSNNKYKLGASGNDGYKCSINELHMQTLSTTYNWPSSLKAKPSTTNSKAPLMNLEYQNNNSWNTDTAVLTFLWPVSLMMQINFCHITDLQDNVFFLAWTIWNNSYNIYQVFLFHLIFLICSLWNPFELCKENILQKQNKPLCVNLQKYIQRQIRHTDSFVRTKFKENSQGCPGLFLRQNTFLHLIQTSEVEKNERTTQY